MTDDDIFVRTMTGAGMMCLAFLFHALGNWSQDTAGFVLAIPLYLGAIACYAPVCVEVIRRIKEGRL